MSQPLHPLFLISYLLLLMAIIAAFKYVDPFYVILALIGWLLGLLQRFSGEHGTKYRPPFIQILNLNLKAMGHSLSDLKPLHIILLLLILSPLLIVLFSMMLEALK